MLEVKVPELAESITEVTLAQYLVEDGDYVEMDQAICEMETDKASQELYAEKAGKIQLIAEAGEDLQVGALICKIDTDAINVQANQPKDANEEKTESKEPTKTEKKPEAKPIAEKEADSSSHVKGHASPAAAKAAREGDIDTSNISGTGKDGRITKQDVIDAIKNGASPQAAAAVMLKGSASFSREESSKKISRLRRTISKRLVHAKNSTAMLTTFNEVDCSAMMSLRTKYKEKFKEKHGVGLGFMSFFTRASALSLMKFPEVNAYLDEEKNEILYHDYADISIAVSTPKGLVVPVIRNAESLSMDGIEKAVKDLAIRGRNGELGMDDMEGGTFTITNGGVFGSLMSTPIINPPQSAILGMHKIEQRPIAVNGEVVIKPMMYVALSYDHRIIDGKESVSFLVNIKDYLENPEKLLLGEDPTELLFGL